MLELVQRSYKITGVHDVTDAIRFIFHWHLNYSNANVVIVVVHSMGSGTSLKKGSTFCGCFVVWVALRTLRK